MKLCVIYNSAPLYRAAIFQQIDKEFDCDWFFSELKSDIKQMDTSVLNCVHGITPIYFHNKNIWKRGLIKLLFKKEYRKYLMLFETRSLTDWLFVFLYSLFFRRKKLYIWTHGWYGKESGSEAKLKRWLYKQVTGIFVYGNYARRLIVEQGIDKNKVFTIHNSLQYAEQLEIRRSLKPSNIYKEHFGNDNPVIIFIGRLTKVKRLDLLISAIARLKNTNELYNLVIVGDGTENKALISLSQETRIAENTWFYGACYDEKENAELIYNADLCVAPGNVGLTAVHTMMFGTPVISHNDFKWQMPEFEAIKKGETGSFFEIDNVESLAQSIHDWFENKKNRREEVRDACYEEIDTQWNPAFQIDVLKKHLQ